MHEHSFKILGIRPTLDGRAVRSAYLRLARIYHPDRFAGQPADVRIEAETKMKELTEAYEHLRSSKRRAATQPPSADRPGGAYDPWRQATEFRASIRRRRLEDEARRQRWERWESLENAARARAQAEAREAARLAAEEGAPIVLHPVEHTREPLPLPRSQLAIRLDSAKAGARGAIARRAP